MCAQPMHEETLEVPNLSHLNCSLIYYWIVFSYVVVLYAMLLSRRLHAATGNLYSAPPTTVPHDWGRTSFWPTHVKAFGMNSIGPGLTVSDCRIWCSLIAGSKKQ